MKKINSILLLTTLSMLATNKVQANVWQDTLDKLTNISKNIPATPTTKRGTLETPHKGTLEHLGFDLEHAQKLAQKTTLRAVEAANSSVSAIKNVALHLSNIQQINKAVEYLNNVASGRGNSLEQAEKAKQILHEILSEARKLEKNSKEATKQIEKTLRTTTKLHQRLSGTSTALHNPTLSKIWDTIKTNMPSK